MTPTDPTPDAPAAAAPPKPKLLTLRNFDGSGPTVEVTTNYDVMGLICAEIDAADAEMRKHLKIGPGTVIGVHSWAIVMNGPDAGAIVAVTGIRHRIGYSDPKKWVEVIGLDRDGCLWRHEPLENLRRAASADYTTPAVLLGDLGW